MKKTLTLLFSTALWLALPVAAAELKPVATAPVIHPPYLGISAKIYQLKPQVSLTDAIGDLEASSLPEGRYSPRMLTKTGQTASLKLSGDQEQITLEIQSAADASSYQLTMTWQPNAQGEQQPVSNTLLQTQLDTPLYLLHEIANKRQLLVLTVSGVQRQDDF